MRVNPPEQGLSRVLTRLNPGLTRVNPGNARARRRRPPPRTTNGPAPSGVPGRSSSCAYSGMLPCAPRPAGAAASAATSRRRVCGRRDDLVHDADLQRPVDAAGDPLVLGGQLRVQRLALAGRGRGELLAVQDADGGLGAHHGDLGARPGEHRGGAQRRGRSSRCRRRRRPCGSPGSPAARPPRRRRAAASRRAAPRRPTPGRRRAGSRARRPPPPAGRRTRRTSARTGPPSPPTPSPGSRRAAAGCWRSPRPSGRPSRPSVDDDVGRPPRVQLQPRPVEQRRRPAACTS